MRVQCAQRKNTWTQWVEKRAMGNDSNKSPFPATQGDVCVLPNVKRQVTSSLEILHLSNKNKSLGCFYLLHYGCEVISRKKKSKTQLEWYFFFYTIMVALHVSLSLALFLSVCQWLSLSLMHSRSDTQLSWPEFRLHALSSLTLSPCCTVSDLIVTDGATLHTSQRERALQLDHAKRCVCVYRRL